MTILWDFVKTINNKKNNPFDNDPDAELLYGRTKFVINRTLAGFKDCIHYVNFVNQYHTLDSKIQFDFLLNSIPKGNRYSDKKQIESTISNLELVKEYFGYSNVKAKEALDVLTPDAIAIIETKMFKGGK